MSLRDLDLDGWERLGSTARGRVAREIAEAALVPCTFLRLQTFALAGTAHETAVFAAGDVELVLVPGGDVRLGVDRTTLATFATGAYVDRVLTRPRTVRVPSLLVERQPFELGLEPIAADDPAVQRGLATFGPRFEIQGTLRVRRVGNRVEAWRIHAVPRERLEADFAERGFQLLTPDAWEHACGAGARTLFRWGDDCPRDRYPTDNTADEARRKEEWARSGARFVPDEPDFVLHRLPNAFGLTIARNPYEHEVTADPDVLRGGDGGCNVAAGASFALGWLPLATAFEDRALAAQRSTMSRGDLAGTFARRALPVG